MTHRDLVPEEVAEIAALAAEYSDLREIRPLIAQLRGDVATAQNVNIDAYLIRPQSVKDLLLLLEKEVVTVEWVKARLPGATTTGPAPESEPTIPELKVLTIEHDWTVRDKRVSA